MKRALLLTLMAALTLSACGTTEAQIVPEPEIATIEAEPEIHYYWMDGYYYPAERLLCTVDAEGRIDEWADVEFCLDYNNELYKDEDMTFVAVKLCDNGTPTIHDDKIYMFKAWTSRYNKEYQILISSEDEVQIIAEHEEEE